MAILRKPIKSFLTVVAFLVLTAISIVIYSGNEEQRVELNNNNLYQKTRQVFVAVWSAAQGVASWNLSRDLGSGNDLVDRIKEEAKSQGMENDATAWSDLWSSIKDNWNNRNQDAINNQDAFNNDEEINQDSSTVSDSSPADNILEAEDIKKTADLYKMVSIEDTENGSQLVLRSKSGQEYKVNWPFNKK